MRRFLYVVLIALQAWDMLFTKRDSTQRRPGECLCHTLTLSLYRIKDTKVLRHLYSLCHTH